MRSRTVVFLAICIVGSVTADAEPVSALYRAGQDDGLSVLVWLPNGSETVRGLLIWGNGFGSDDRNVVMNTRWQAFCRQYHFAFIGTSSYGNDMGGREGRALLRQIADVAKQSGHPELKTAPVIFTGHSNGGQMAWEFNAAYPERTIVFSLSKGGYYRTIDNLPAAALGTPAFFVIGAQDDPRRGAAISYLFNLGRSQGAPWAIAVEPNVGHELGHSEEVWLPFFAWAIENRLPRTSDSGKRSALQPVDMASGWLVVHEEMPDKLRMMPARAAEVEPTAQTSWLPTKELAQATIILDKGR